MKNDRMEALELNQKRYKMTKPCRRGHLGERYTASGLCVDCVAMNGESRSEQLRAARILRNTKLFEPSRVYSVILRQNHHDAFNDHAHVCAFGTPEQIEQCAAFIGMIRAQVTGGPATPRPADELTRDTLAAAVSLEPATLGYRDGSPLNERTTADGAVQIQVGAYWYDALKLRALWQGERTSVRRERE